MNNKKLIFTLFALGAKLESAASYYSAGETDLGESEVESVVLMLSTVMREQTGVNIEDYLVGGTK